MRGELGGAVEWRWEPGGLVCEVAVPTARAVAAEAPPGGAAPLGARAAAATAVPHGGRAASPGRRTAVPS